MSSHFRRTLGLCLAAAGILLAVSCASSQDAGGVFNPPVQDAGFDNSADTSMGGFAGNTATGGSSGTTGMAGFPSTGGTAGAGVGGFGAGGSGAGGGTDSGIPGSCNPNFCPTDPNGGTPCCTTPNGPCGIDTGMGCQAAPTQDF